MILPYFGSLRIWVSTANLNGRSYAESFIIRKGNKIIGGSEGMSLAEMVDANEKNLTSFARKFFLIELTIFLPVLIFATENSIPVKIFWFLIMVLIFQLIDVLAILYLKFGKMWEYHACEHKVLHLLYERLEPTIENLKKMPKTSLRCGNTPLALIVLFICFVVLTSFLYFGDLKFLPQLIYKIPPLIVILDSSVSLAFILHPFLTLKEPRESILQEGVEIAKKASENL